MEKRIGALGLAWIVGGWVGKGVALGAREVDDDLGAAFVFGMELMLDGEEGAERRRSKLQV
jgi:hypothetical protein